ncbi:prenyltransferase/squalene oxidase repeat-containing protein [Actinocorallia longicatena]|uniref:Prenyltransferase alpha-alpha toroid domain-containing protein n=1 Tax=Actinocorallia longicatena TaxID=111803 RepID=A0ABP6QAL1_9ACTN
MILDIRELADHLAVSTETLRDYYRATTDGTGGGWYHELGRPPAATATAVALACFVDKGDPIDHLDQALRFLRSRQREDGGWATATHGEVPVVEATAWIAWCLSRARCELTPGAPDLASAARWLTAHQNPDGGWGSRRGNPSRTWLTCLALRALGLLDPHSAAVADGIGWLLDRRLTAGGARVWGMTEDGGPTLTHTAFALLTLAELRPLETDEHLRAFRWLAERVEANPRDLHRWIETYTAADDGHQWRLNLWHFGLPIAVSALLHHPEGPPSTLLGRAVARLLRVPPGTHVWGDETGPPTRLSLWSLWWSLQALSGVYRFPLFRRDDLVVWVRDAVIIRRGPARRRPLFTFLPGLWSQGLGLLLARFWAYVTVALLAAVLAAGAIAGLWEWDLFWSGLIIPVLLIPLQEGIKRRGG